jgi:uncharacterized protein YneF (UPF0154 family)
MKEELIMKLAENITMVMIFSIIGGLLIGWYATYVYFKSHKVSASPSEKDIVRETMRRNNICGYKVKTIDELVAELKCDNLQLMANLKGAEYKIDQLEEQLKRQKE